jgi:nucleoside-diphosphate-sugar epimerase
MPESKSPVLVTGANGYVASWLVKMLLDAGYTVHATVRDKSNPSKVSHLQKAAEPYPDKLKLFNADLFDDGAFDIAMQDCEWVFHTASPFLVRGITDPQKQLIEPALQGTRNVLNAANRTDSVKRVILTSSVVAIYGDNIDMQKINHGLPFTEDNWNKTSSADHQPYPYSKKLAEEEAWNMAKNQNRWDLVVTNPGLVLGPSLAKASDSTSLSTMLELVNGKLKTGVPNLRFPVVDVRDVALAHINAAEMSNAKGRHILVNQSISLLEMAKILRAKYGSKYAFPRWQVPKFIFWLVAPFFGVSRKFVSTNVGHSIEFENSKAKTDLNIAFRSVEETLIDHCQQIIDDGLV